MGDGALSSAPTPYKPSPPRRPPRFLPLLSSPSLSYPIRCLHPAIPAQVYPTTHFSQPTHLLIQNDWRQVRRQGQRRQGQRSIVSLLLYLLRRVLLLPGLLQGSPVSSDLCSFFHLGSTSRRTFSDSSQPFVQGRSRVPRRSCPQTPEEGQLRSACRCW
jgi:hypothetical protein